MIDLIIFQIDYIPTLSIYNIITPKGPGSKKLIPMATTMTVITVTTEADKHDDDMSKLQKEHMHKGKELDKTKSERLKEMEERVRKAELAALEMAAKLGEARANGKEVSEKLDCATVTTWLERTLSRHFRGSVGSSAGAVLQLDETMETRDEACNERHVQFDLDIMDTSLALTENSKQITRLLTTVGTLILDEDKTKRLLNHWEYKSTRLSMQSNGFESKVHDLDNWRKIQDERITSVHRGELTVQSDHQFKFAKRAALDPTFRITLDRVAKEATCINEQIREEAKIEIMALEECVAMDKDDLGPKRELVAMKAILEIIEKEVDVYRISCETCRNDQINFVGPIETDLKAAVDKHIDQVAKLVSKSQGRGVLSNIFKRSKAKGKASPTTETASSAPKRGSMIIRRQKAWSNDAAKSKSKNDGPNPHEAWSKDFAKHVSQHVKPKSKKSKSESQSDVIDFCRENLKVEVLQRQPEGNLHWHQPSLY